MKKTSKFDCVYSSVHKRLLYWIAGLCLVGTFLFPVDVIAQKVTVRIEKGTLDNAFQKIMKSSDIQLVYRTDMVTNIQCEAHDFKQEELSNVLKVLLENTSLTYQKRNGVYNIVEKRKQYRQQPEVKGKVSGKVVDKNGEAIIGATVLIKNTSKGVITDVDGNFVIEPVNAERLTLQIKYVGMKTIEAQVRLNSNNVFTLEEDINLVSEVVVTGYQVLSKERASGSFATVSSKEIESKLQTSLMDRLEGSVAGMTSYRGLQIRGVSTLIGTSTPLYVVDGVPYEGTLAAINPSEVVNVTVLKDAAAASIYGARAANGVIVITTRSGEEGQTRVHYNGSIKFTPLYDTDYLNLMSSEEFVNFQQEMFNVNPGTVAGDRYYMNEVRALLFDNKNGKISDEELEKQLDVYRHRDR